MNEKLNILELIDSLAEKHGMSKKNAESFVREFFQLIEETLENDKYVKVKGLGTFKLIDVERRESVNVNTGERFEIQGHTKVSFTPDPTLKETVNKPFSHFETVVLNESTVLDDTPVMEEEKEPAPTDPVASTETDTSVAPASDIQNPDAPVEESVQEPVVEIAEKEPPVPEADKEESPSQEVGTEIEEQKETQEDVEKAKTMQEKKEYSSTMKYFIGIVVFVVLLCVGAVLFMYYPDWFDGTSSEREEEETTALQDTVESDENSLLQDEKDVSEEPVGTQIEDTDSQPVVTDTDVRESRVLEAVQVNDRKAPVAETKPEEVTEPASPLSSSSVYEITGLKATHTVSQGETLTRISLKYYGTKELWSYIVKYNPQIKNPDNVPYGTKLKIPELVKK